MMAILQDSWEDKKKYGLKNLATICYEVSEDKLSTYHLVIPSPFQTLQYLTESPVPVKSQTKEKIAEFRTEMKRFKLTDNEIFNMVNDPPTSLLHIQLLIEDSEERLTEDQVNEILQTIQRLLLPPTIQEGETENGAEGDDDDDDGGQDDEAVEA